MQQEAIVIILEGNEQVQCYSLSEKSTWTFGRKTEQNQPDLSVRSKIVSREHGEFECMDGVWFYIDKGSMNGTYHNGKKISSGLKKKVRPVMLNHGDVLRIDSDDLDAPDSRGVRILFLTEQVSENIEEMNREQIIRMVMEYDRKE